MVFAMGFDGVKSQEKNNQVSGTGPAKSSCVSKQIKDISPEKIYIKSQARSKAYNKGFANFEEIFCGLSQKAKNQYGSIVQLGGQVTSKTTRTAQKLNNTEIQ